MEIPIASRQFLDPSILVSKASLLVYADLLLFFDWKWNFCLTINEDPGSLADRISIVVSVANPSRRVLSIREYISWSTITGNSCTVGCNSGLKYRTNVYQGGLVRRLITVCNKFEWPAVRTKPLSRKGCDMLADVVHESLEITEYRCDSHPFPLSIPPLGSLPPVSASNATPRSALSNRPPFLLVRSTVSIRQIIGAITKPTKGNVSPVQMYAVAVVGHAVAWIIFSPLRRVLAYESRRFRAR